MNNRGATDVIIIVILATCVILALAFAPAWPAKWELFAVLTGCLVAFIVGEIVSKVRTKKTITQNLKKLKESNFAWWLAIVCSLAAFFIYVTVLHLGFGL